MSLKDLGLIFSKLAKLHSSFIPRQSTNKFQHRQFKVSSNTKCKVMKSSDENSLVSGVEQIATLKLVSKKNNHLSVVEEKDIETVDNLKKGDLFYPYKGPGDRILNIVSQELKETYHSFVKLFTGVELGVPKKEFFPRYTDVVIIGGGVIGIAIAHALRNAFPHGPNVVVVEKDPNFLPNSINRSQGIVSLQLFSDEEEIEILKYGAVFFSEFQRQVRCYNKPSIKLQFDPVGSLILVDSTNIDNVLVNNNYLKLHGVRNSVIDNKTLKNKFPWLNVEDVLFGSLGGGQEGVIDPWAYVYGLKAKAINLGVQFVTAEVVDFGYNHSSLSRAICKLPDGSYNSIQFNTCVLAGGIETLNLVNLLNSSENFSLKLKLPLEERSRFEYCFYNPNGPGINTPIVIDSEGTYFRRDGLCGHYVAGVPPVICDVDDESLPYRLFEEKVKPFLMKRIPSFNKFDLVKGWTDTYEYCFSNKIGIAGPHPESHNVVFALGFSNLGMQYIPALARATLEFIYYDEYRTIDFTNYHVEHLWRKQHLEAEQKKKEALEAQQRVAISE